VKGNHDYIEANWRTCSMQRVVLSLLLEVSTG
jgi:hypothetical protein